MDPTRCRTIIQELQAVLAQCTDQIAQMEGMFDDEDGTIRNALDEAEEMQQKASRFLRGTQQEEERVEVRRAAARQRLEGPTKPWVLPEGWHVIPDAPDET